MLANRQDKPNGCLSTSPAPETVVDRGDKKITNSQCFRPKHVVAIAYTKLV